MKELKCPACNYLNPDIRELGYTLPFTCGRCPHIWRLQDMGQLELPKTKAEALAVLVGMGIATKDGQLTPEYGGPPQPPLSETGYAGGAERCA